MSEPMQVCESCGTKFPPSNEVQSSRILCPPCAEKRRAALRAAKAGGGAAAGAAKPATAAAPAAVPAAAAAEPAPATRVARPARTPAAAGRREAEEAGAQKTQRRARSPEEHLDVRKMKADAQARLMKVAWGVTGGVALLTGIVWLFAQNKKASLAEENARQEKMLDDFRTDVSSVDLNNEAALKAVKERIDAERKLWRFSRIESDVSQATLKINAALQVIDKTRNLKTQVDGIERDLGANPTVEKLGKLFVDVRDPVLRDQAADAPAALKQQYDAAVKNVERTYIDALRSACTSARSSTTGEGLAPFGQLEDTLAKVIDEATAAKDVETVNAYLPVRLQVINESNEIVTKLFDDAYVDRVPWKDLLADPSGWLEVTHGSFTHKFGGGLTLTNQAGETASTGGLSYTPGDNWRDYVVEAEVTLQSGQLVFYARIGDVMDLKAVPGFTMGLKGGVFEANKTYQVVIKVIGRTLAVTVDGVQQPGDTNLKASLSRRGEPGIAAQPGTGATITKLRVRHLR